MKKISGSILGIVGLVLAVAPAGAVTYEIDTAHAEVGFSIRHMGISNVRGNFDEFSGTITYDGSDVLGVAADATIKTESVNTGNKKRDDHLRNPDFFDATGHPELSFESTGVEKNGDGFVLNGNLTMRGVTKPVSLVMSVAGPIEDPWGNQRIGLEISTTVKRHDWGIGKEGPTDLAIGKDVKIEINLEAIAK